MLRTTDTRPQASDYHKGAFRPPPGRRRASGGKGWGCWVGAGGGLLLGEFSPEKSAKNARETQHGRGRLIHGAVCGGFRSAGRRCGSAFAGRSPDAPRTSAP